MIYQQPIAYFDNNATTRIDPEVVKAMQPLLEEWWGNPSSAYGFGKEVARQVAMARNHVADLIQADPQEVIFTSGGTESINSALHGVLAANPGKRHVVTTAVEHPATLRYCAYLEKLGYDLTYLPVNAEGCLDVDRLEQAIRPDTALVSVMWANNETGILFPVEAIAAVCRRKGALFHTDAVQVAGKLPIDVKTLGVDLLSLSAHKIHGPKGVGLLYLRKRTPYEPLLRGGHQERGRRGGTENTPGIVGFGRAAELARPRLARIDTQTRALRDHLENSLRQRIPQARRTGAAEPRLPNTTHLSFPGVEAEAILIMLDQLGICASSGSACTTGALEPSHVLRAMGMSPQRARSCLRFSLGVCTTPAEVELLLQHLPAIVSRLRQASPFIASESCP